MNAITLITLVSGLLIVAALVLIVGIAVLLFDTHIRTPRMTKQEADRNRNRNREDQP